MAVDPLIANDLALNSLITDERNRENVWRSKIIPTSGGRTTDVTARIHEWQQQNAGSSILVFPSDRPKFYMALDISEYTNPSGTSVAFKTIGTMVLPLPMQLIDAHQVVYSEEQIGLLVGSLIGSAEAVASKFSKNTEAGNQDIGSLGNISIGQMTNDLSKLYQGFDLSEEVKTKLAQGVGILGLGAVGDLATAYLGMSPNQFLTVLLKGPAYKRYQMNWKLVPKTYEESETIRKIINMMNNSMSPGLTGQGTVFTFPRLFRPYFQAAGPNKEFHKFLFRFKPSVMTDIQINYAPGGLGAFYHDSGENGEHNPPESVEIIANFLELEFWLKNDFLDDPKHEFDTRGPRGP